MRPHPAGLLLTRPPATPRAGFAGMLRARHAATPPARHAATPPARHAATSPARHAATLAALVALLGGAAPAGAEALRPPGIGAADPRIPVAVAEAPWRALGRVHVAGGLCTGALVGPRTVLTAAHCLVGRNTRALVAPAAVSFLLGYDRGAFVAQARAVAIRTAPEFDPARRRPGPEWADWALLTLDTPLGTAGRVLPLAREAPPPRTPLLAGGYQQDRREVLLADPGCRLLGLQEAAPGRPLMLHDCAATRGASGAPLLMREGAGFAVVGVMVGVAREGARGVARDGVLGVAVPAVALPAP